MNRILRRFLKRKHVKPSPSLSKQEERHEEKHEEKHEDLYLFLLKQEENLSYLSHLLGEERINRFLALSKNILETSPLMKEFEDFVKIIRMLQFMEEQKDLPWWQSKNYVVACYYQLKYYHTGILLVDPSRLECGFYLMFKGSPFVKRKYDQILKIVADSDSKKYEKIMTKAKKNAIPFMPEEFAMHA